MSLFSSSPTTTSYQHNTNDNERSSLLQVEESRNDLPVTTRSRNDSKRTTTSLVCNSILIVLFIIVIICIIISSLFIVYIQKEINSMQETINNDETTITKLNTIVTQQDTIIQRFNTTISNLDVINTIQQLQNQINSTTTTIYNQLSITQSNINNQLNTTQQQIQFTINDAQLTIKQQVQTVQDNVNQYVITTQDQFSIENNFLIYQLAGTFTVLSCLCTMYHMTNHIRTLNQPFVQRKILAILWMVPIYAITSWFSLVFPKSSGYLAILKDGYEGYVIYTFLSFCISVIASSSSSSSSTTTSTPANTSSGSTSTNIDDNNRRKVVTVLAEHSSINEKHPLPPPDSISNFLCFKWCCPTKKYDTNYQLADAVLLQCQQYAIQFVFLRPLLTLIHVILKQYNCLVYYDNFTQEDILWDYRSPQLYIIIIQNISIFFAFHGLLRFYHAVDNELIWCRPFAKFLCIKGVVFMTFWQGLAISILAQTTISDTPNSAAAVTANIHNNNTMFTTVSIDEKERQWAESAQNFLICLEMLLFSIAHFYCFPIDEWEDGYREKQLLGLKGTTTNFSDTVALGDFVADLKLVLSSNHSNSNNNKTKSKKNITSKKIKSRSLLLSSSTIPEGDDESYTSNITNTTTTSTNIGNDDEERGIVSFDDDDDDTNDNNKNDNDSSKSLLVAKLQQSFNVLIKDDPTVVHRILETARREVQEQEQVQNQVGTELDIQSDSHDDDSQEDVEEDDDDNNNSTTKVVGDNEQHLQQQQQQQQQLHSLISSLSLMSSSSTLLLPATLEPNVPPPTIPPPLAPPSLSISSSSLPLTTTTTTTTTTSSILPPSSSIALPTTTTTTSAFLPSTESTTLLVPSSPPPLQLPPILIMTDENSSIGVDGTIRYPTVHSHEQQQQQQQDQPQLFDDNATSFVEALQPTLLETSATKEELIKRSPSKLAS